MMPSWMSLIWYEEMPLTMAPKGEGGGERASIAVLTLALRSQTPTIALALTLKSQTLIMTLHWRVLMMPLMPTSLHQASILLSFSPLKLQFFLFYFLV